MKKFILIIIAVFLFTSCGVALVTYDDYYGHHPYPSYRYYYGGRPYYHYDYHYVPRHYRPTPPPPPKPKPNPNVRPGPQRHDPPGKPSHQPRPRPNGNDRAVRPSGGTPGRGPVRSNGGTRRH